MKMPYWFSSGFIWSHMWGIWFQLVPVTRLLVSTGPSCQCSGLLLVSFGPSYRVSGFELVPVVSGLVCYWFHLVPVSGQLIQTGPSCNGLIHIWFHLGPVTRNTVSSLVPVATAWCASGFMWSQLGSHQTGFNWSQVIGYCFKLKLHVM